jgi:ribosomal protein S18 acetylase RimI-like enzyme
VGRVLRSVDREFLYQQNLRSLSAFHHVLGSSSGDLIETESAVASFVPFAPDAPFLTSVVATCESSLRTASSEISRRASHARPGVWVSQDLAEAAVRLGLSRIAVVALMGAFLDDLDLVGADARRVEPAAVGSLNDLVYGNEDGRLRRAFSALPSSQTRGYGRQGEAAQLLSGALAIDFGLDCSVEYVATRPDAQRTGHASSVVRRLLYEAKGRGQTTVSLRASSEGAELYSRLGLANLGTLEVWQKPARNPHPNRSPGSS